MNKIIVITSGKGGVGKTTTAINLGAAMNYFGKDVLIIDGNLSTPNVGIHLNSPEVPINLNHVLLGKAEAKEAMDKLNNSELDGRTIVVSEAKPQEPRENKSYSNRW